MKKSIGLLLVLVGLFTPSCFKNFIDNDDPQLPNIYNTHPQDLSIFGCLVNGEVWRPQGLFNTISYTYNETIGGFRLTAERKEDNQIIELNAQFFDVGTYEQLEPFPFTDGEYCSAFSTYDIDTLSTQFIAIDSFYKDRGVILGRFEFTAINHECPDTLVFTDGRFKATYK